jgi:hypothetical protein
MAVPVALWCGLVAARALLPGLALSRSVADGTTISFWDAILALLQVVEVCLACVLVAELVHEDNVTGTTAWWMTRPISGARLLGAKLLSSGLLLTVAPTITLSLVWIGADFSARELVSAAAWCVVVHELIVVLALGMAALTGNAAQFLFGSIALMVLTAMVGFLGFERYVMAVSRPLGALASGREWIGCVIVLWPAGLFVHQFLTRQRGRTVVLLGAGLALIAGIRLGWMGTSRPLTRLGLWNDSLRWVDRANDDGVTVALTRVEATDTDPAAKLNLRVAATRSVNGLYFRLQLVSGEWLWAGKPDESATYNRQMEAVGRPEETAVKAIAGLAAADAAVEWSVGRNTPSALNSRPPGRPQGFRGKVWLLAMRGRLVGELPIQTGATLRAGSCVTRVVGFDHAQEKTFVVIEERDALPMRKYWLDPGRLRGRPGEVEDYYLLLDRANKREQLLEPGPSESLCADAIVTGQRRLEVPDWAEGATLIKVRFEADHVFSRPLVLDRLPVEVEAKQP